MPLGKFIPELYPNLHPVFIECRNGNTSAVLSYLESGLSVDIKDDNHASLIEQGADANLTDQTGFSPLMSASAGGDIDMIELLLRHGANSHQASQRGRTALMEAVSSDQVASICWWVAHGAALEHRDLTGNTALLIAAKGGKLAAAQTLVMQGADIHAKDKHGKTAEDWARANGHPKIVELLQSRMGYESD